MAIVYQLLSHALAQWLHWRHHNETCEQIFKRLDAGSGVLSLVNAVAAQSPLVIPFPLQYEIRREAADSAVARQGEATTYRIELEMELQRKIAKTMKVWEGLLDP